MESIHAHLYLALSILTLLAVGGSRVQFVCPWKHPAISYASENGQKQSKK